MNDPNGSNSGDQSNLPATISQPGNLLDAALAHLPPAQRKALAEKALERKLDIDAKAIEADNRYRASSVEMAKTISFVRGLENTTKTDYTVNASFETASGQTRVEIKKSNNTVIIVIAIVIAVIVFMMFAK